MPSPRQMALRRLKWCRSRADYTRDCWALFTRGGPLYDCIVAESKSLAEVRVIEAHTEETSVLAAIQYVSRQYILPAVLDWALGRRRKP